MKTLLYITANSKSEDASASKTVGRRLVDAMLSRDRELQLEELDLYEKHIPRIKSSYYSGRSQPIGEDAKNALPKHEQEEIDAIINLCSQFCRADYYVLAAPMWSLSYPAVVKEYIDCIVQTGKTIEFKSNKPSGLLNDKKRAFVYVQSSGASIPWMIRPVLNKGLNYVLDIVKFLGVDTVTELLVDGTGTTNDEQSEAVKKATEKIDGLVNKLFA